MNMAEQPRTVLIADDDATVRLLMQESLEQLGYAVRQALNGVGALELFHADPRPDFVILDVDMPGKNGFEVCAAIREEDPLGMIPVVMVTGMDDSTSIDQAYENGATFFIVKPINWALLGYMIRYIMRTTQLTSDLAASETKIRAMIEAMPDAILRLDRDGICLEIEGSSESRGLLPGSQLEGKRLGDILRAEYSGADLDHIKQCLETRVTQTAEYSLVTTGGMRFLEVRFAAASDNEVMALIRDISERKNAEKRIHQLAYFDVLTGLPNRHYFIEQVSKVISRYQDQGRQFVVAILDLDNFQGVVDSLGHEFGDHILQSMGKRLTNLVNDNELVARGGGDEFFLLFDDFEDRAVAEETILSTLKNRIKEPFFYHRDEVMVTASIGLASYPANGNNPKTLIKCADTALNHAKKMGKDGWQWYQASHTDSAVRRLELENNLRRAIERKEFRVYYQAQVETHDFSASSFEALLRWERGDGVIVSPAEFIPLAEEKGLIIEMGKWVIEEVCRQLSVWNIDTDSKLKVAVNICARQLRRAEFVDEVIRIVESSGIDPTWLKIELTESAFIDKAEENIQKFNRLREFGIEIQLDDFGTGYSSLSYLHRIPAEMLKIDRSFVRDVTSNEDSYALVNSIIAMAKTLRMGVIAEGVETEEQSALLSGLGCDVLQGFFYSRPRPADEAYKELVGLNGSKENTT
jgi:diguanylate cyclase (GGDEF)-like protein/PAS domain S-box-containing protein